MHSFVNNATLTKHACYEWQYNAKVLGSDLYDTMMGTSFDIDVWALCFTLKHKNLQTVSLLNY